MVDESPDANGNSVGAFIVASLDDMKKGPFVVYVDKLKNGCDTDGYKKFYTAGLNRFYPNGESEYIYIMTKFVAPYVLLYQFFNEGIPADKVLAIVTDGAPVMKSMVRVLKEELLTNKVLHLTCTAHGLHNIVKDVSQNLQNLSNLFETKSRLVDFVLHTENLTFHNQTTNHLKMN